MGLFSVGITLSSLAVFGFTYHAAQSISREHQETDSTRDQALAQSVAQQLLGDFGTRLRSAAADHRIEKALLSGNLARTKQLLSDHAGSAVGTAFDLLVLDIADGDTSLKVGSAPELADPLLPREIRTGLLPDIWNLVAQTGDHGTDVLAVLSIPLKTVDDGTTTRAVLTGATSILEHANVAEMIAQKLGTDRVRVKLGDLTVSEIVPPTTQPNMEGPFPFAPEASPKAIDSVLIENPLGLPLTAEIFEPDLATLHLAAAYKEFLPPFTLTVLVACVIASAILHRLISPSLSYLIAYAHELRQGRANRSHQKSRFQEFNTLATLFSDAFEANQRTNAQFRDLIDGSLQGVFVHANKHILYVNNALLEMLGYESGNKKQLVGKPVTDLYAKEEHRQLNQVYKLRADGGTAPRIYEARAQRQDGSVVWLEQHVRMISWNGEEAFYATVLDITDRKRQEQQIALNANYDSVTGLPNRYLFLDRLKQAIGRAQSKHEKCTLLFLDVDRFKSINETLGHEAGDQLLANIAWRVQQILGPSESAARLGGDQIGVLLNTVKDSWDAEQKALGLLEAVSAARPGDVETNHLATASVGIAIGPADGDNPDLLLRHAEFAMFQAKLEGGNRCRFYSHERNDAATRAMKLEFALTSAIDQKKLKLHYQPIVDFESGQIISCEALLRWNDPEFGDITPSEFIPIAEETGLIVPLGDWVLQEACSFFKDCKKRGLDLQCISVNVSPRQCRDDGFVSRVAQVIAETRIAPSQLHLEITETVMMDDSSIDPAMVLDALRDIGVKLSLDDFGTGYSSLSYLKRLPIDILKIDSSFILDLEEDEEDQVLIRAIRSMAENLGITVICEGAETAPQCRILADLGCQLIQGYHIARPMPERDFIHFLTTNAMSIPPNARLH
ncbi:diguanylate cyclase/phosphodiesterase with PAS/PAC and GAF sensor [Roseibium sp. TrichSKD4]|nr:diguanylate cyclase/phosphodiesterase with PAS/PAC and GAF sensor [Roseibium sp. TrichSKD4]